MDFSEGHWDIIDIIMEMKEKDEYLDKVEKRARNNFARVLNVIEKASSSSMDYSDRLYYAESKEYKLDKSKKFFTTINKSGKKKGKVRKISLLLKIEENEEFIEEMEEEYEYYEDWGQFDLSLHLAYSRAGVGEYMNYEPQHRDFPKGLSLEEFMDYYVWENGIHYEIRYSSYHKSYYADWKYQEERPLKILSAVKDIEEKMKMAVLENREKHKELFKGGIKSYLEVYLELNKDM
jgi:hypothetical protein